MQVRSLDAVPIEMSVKPMDEIGGIAPYVTRGHAHEQIERTLVRLRTENGQTGWGEIRAPLSSYSTTTAIVDDVVAPAIVGKDVHEIPHLANELDFTYMSIAPIVGGVEMAMWDAWGKQLDEPVYRLLGGKSVDDIDVAYCLGIVDVETARDKAREARDQGFDIIKTKGGRDWRQDVRRVIAMHDAVEGELDFRLDPNQGWSYDEAVRVGAHLEADGVYLQYLEQPIATSQFGTLRQLRSRLRTPIAVNEDTYQPGNLFQAVKTDSIDAAVIDITPAGGLLAAQRLANVANAAGISVAHHTGFDLGIKTAAMLHFIVSTPAVNLPPDTTYYAWPDDILETPLKLTDGKLSVPDDPGLGVTVDETKVDEYRIDT